MRKLEEEGIEGRQLVCVDETAVDQRLTTRLRGWAKRGERVTVKGPFTRPIRYDLCTAVLLFVIESATALQIHRYSGPCLQRVYPC